MVESIRAGRFSWVIAYHPTRLLRSMRELEDLCDLVEKTRLQVAFVQAPDYDLNTANGRMVARLLASVAQNESEVNSERIQRKMLAIVEAGRPGGGDPPYGYKKTPSKELKVEPREAELVNEAVDRILAGETLYSIQQDWISRKIPTRRGARWSTTALKAMVTKGSIAGLRTHHGTVVGPASWTAIVDAERWNRVRTILLDPGRSRKVPNRSYLLTGLLTCGSCDRPLASIARSPKKKAERGPGTSTRAYGCKLDRGGCGHVHMLAEPLEEYVMELAFHTTEGQLFRRRLSKTKDAKKSDRAILASIAEDERALLELSDMWAQKQIGRDEWMRQRVPISERIETAKAQLHIVGNNDQLKRIVDQHGSVRAAWPTLSLQTQRDTLAAIYLRLSVHPATGVRHRFDPDRILYVWRV